MRKAIPWIFSAVMAVVLFLTFPRSHAPRPVTDPYNREAAVAYAQRWALERNPEYADLESNCTNYVSQVLAAGGKQMDEPVPPTEGRRITYHARKDRWFSASMHSNPERWQEFSLSTSFCRTEDFVDYWTRERGMELTLYDNALDGLLALNARAEVGDIILLYDERGKPMHLCVLVEQKNLQLLVNANTQDFQNHNLLHISPMTYPQVGLLKMR